LPFQSVAPEDGSSKSGISAAFPAYIMRASTAVVSRTTAGPLGFNESLPLPPPLCPRSRLPSLAPLSTWRGAEELGRKEVTLSRRGIAGLCSRNAAGCVDGEYGTTSHSVARSLRRNFNYKTLLLVLVHRRRPPPPPLVSRLPHVPRISCRRSLAYSDGDTSRAFPPLASTLSFPPSASNLPEPFPKLELRRARASHPPPPPPSTLVLRDPGSRDLPLLRLLAALSLLSSLPRSRTHARAPRTSPPFPPNPLLSPPSPSCAPAPAR